MIVPGNEEQRLQRDQALYSSEILLHVSSPRDGSCARISPIPPDTASPFQMLLSPGAIVRCLRSKLQL